MKTLNINYEQNLFDDDINDANNDDKFVYKAPSQYEPNKRTYYTTLNELSTTFNGFTAMKSNLIKNANPPNFIGNERRVEIIKYFVDKRRAFNYSKDTKRYKPYDIAKDAYDYNFYNYGFQQKEV